MSNIDVTKLSDYRENSQIEAKRAQGGLPNSVWETYSSFANTDGGTILLGVEEMNDKSLNVVGLKDASKIEKDFWNKINNRQVTNVNILTNRMVHTETINGKDILVIDVPRAERALRPIYKGQDPKTGTYRRNGEGDYLCTTDEVSAMFRDASIIPMDTKVLEEMDYSVFCQETVRSYRQIFNNLHSNHIWRGLEDEVFLRRIGAMGVGSDGKIHPTSAGLLIFGYEYEITREFPQYFLDYQENRQNRNTRWTNRITSSSGEWSGNIFDFIYKVIPQLCSDLKVPFVTKGVYRIDETPLHKIIREAVTNCMAHSDFYGRRGLVIQKDNEKFSFSNPGNLRVSKREAIEGGVSDPRNATVLKILSMINYGERAGSGLNGIFTIWTKVFNYSPKLEESLGVDRVSLILDTNGNEPDINNLLAFYDYSDNKTDDKPTITNKTDDKPTVTDDKPTISNDKLLSILDFLKRNQEAPTAKIAEHIGLSVTQTKHYLQQLINDGKIIAKGANRNRTYSITH